MPKPVKDLVRHQNMEAMPDAPPGAKKHWNADTQTVTYVPKTPAEVAREAIKPPPKAEQIAVGTETQRRPEAAQPGTVIIASIAQSVAKPGQ